MARSKLIMDPVIVDKIKWLHSRGLPMTVLARKFGCNRATISAIINGKGAYAVFDGADKLEA